MEYELENVKAKISGYHVLEDVMIWVQDMAGWGCGNCEVGQAAAVEIKCLESRLLINSINNN